MLKIDQNFFSSKCDNSYTIQKPMSNLVFLQVLENFMGYSNQKAEKKNLSRSGVISILVKCLKNGKIEISPEILSFMA
jgi:hypothetical protein